MQRRRWAFQGVLEVMGETDGEDGSETETYEREQIRSFGCGCALGPKATRAKDVTRGKKMNRLGLGRIVMFVFFLVISQGGWLRVY